MLKVHFKWNHKLESVCDIGPRFWRTQAAWTCLQTQESFIWIEAST